KDDVSVADCRADGTVVASQVGSTGYSLSAGGPILDPELDAFVLTPICPLTFLRPIVFSAKSTLRIELVRPERAIVVIDGHHQAELRRENPYITIRKSEYESTFVRFRTDFYNRLKARLLFSREEGKNNG
ncbi:MAG: NAD(+) kinase, partial [Candidatus Bathyarchaeia archaeon]